MSVLKSLEHFAVDSRWLRESNGLRLDASHYNPRVAHAVETLRKSGLRLSTLGEVTERIYIPPRFKRIYVDEAHGIPFLQGSHVVQLQPADIKYLSTAAHKDLSRWIIEAGWILVTCSGTVGRVAIAPAQWDGWAASQHILRIIPRNDGPCPAGYLYSYLASPLGQAQLTAQIYGAVVDELTEAQARSVIVPVPETKEQHQQVQAIHREAMESVRQRSEAIARAEQAFGGVRAFIPELARPEETESRPAAGPAARPAKRTKRA
jgi:type I restriction enzyme S subunit